MSLTTEKLISNAKRLADKMKECDTLADSLMAESQNVYKQINAMKQYTEDVGDLNLSGRQRTHSTVLTGMQQDLQLENTKLRAALDDRLNDLGIYMSAYRQAITQQINTSKMDLPSLHNQHNSDIVMRQATQITEMAAVMRKAAQAGDENLSKEININRLTTENQGLKELVSISSKYGNNCILDTASNSSQ